MTTYKRPLNYKAVNFDLRTAALKEKFGESGRAEAYRKIGRYLSEQGFEHRQGSGYRSTTPYSDLDMIDLHFDLYSNLDWLFDCVTRLDVTNIGPEYDMNSIIRRGSSRNTRKPSI